MRARNYNKVYGVDWALGNAVAPAGGVDIMRRFENLVYLDLRRRGGDVFYYRTRKGHEIDFIHETKTARGNHLAIVQGREGSTMRKSLRGNTRSRCIRSEIAFSGLRDQACSHGQVCMRPLSSPVPTNLCPYESFYGWSEVDLWNR